MTKKTPLLVYIQTSKQQNYAQFRGVYSRGKNGFVIATNDPLLLIKDSNVVSADNVPGFSRNEAIITTLHTGHKELFLDPKLNDYRDAHLAFLDAIGVDCGASALPAFDSDHVYPKSAAMSQVEFVKMNLIEASVNRSWGSSWEKRLTHDRLGSPVKLGELAALLKSLGVRISDPKNPKASLQLAAKELIMQGYASQEDSAFLLKRADDCMLDKQTQDENFAVSDGQVDLRPGTPLIPEGS